MARPTGIEAKAAGEGTLQTFSILLGMLKTKIIWHNRGPSLLSVRLKDS
jgi:hypothetical protein